MHELEIGNNEEILNIDWDLIFSKIKVLFLDFTCNSCDLRLFISKVLITIKIVYKAEVH